MTAIVQLHHIAELIRQLPESGCDRYPHRYQRVMRAGARLIRQAYELGAFQGGPYGNIGAFIRTYLTGHDKPIGGKAGSLPLWVPLVWYAVVNTLAPELFEKRSKCAEMYQHYRGGAEVGLKDGTIWQRIQHNDPTMAEAVVVADTIKAEANRFQAAAGDLSGLGIAETKVAGHAIADESQPPSSEEEWLRVGPCPPTDFNAAREAACDCLFRARQAEGILFREVKRGAAELRKWDGTFRALWQAYTKAQSLLSWEVLQGLALACVGEGPRPPEFRLGDTVDTTAHAVAIRAAEAVYSDYLFCAGVNPGIPPTKPTIVPITDNQYQIIVSWIEREWACAKAKQIAAAEQPLSEPARAGKAAASDPFPGRIHIEKGGFMAGSQQFEGDAATVAKRCSESIVELAKLTGETPEQLASRWSNCGASPAESQHSVEQLFFALGLIEDVLELDKPNAPPELMLEAEARLQDMRKLCEAFQRAAAAPAPSNRLVQVAAQLQSPERECVLAMEWLMRAFPVYEMFQSPAKEMAPNVAKLWNAPATPTEVVKAITLLLAEHRRLMREGPLDKRRGIMVLWVAALAVWQRMEPLPPMPVYAGRELFATAYELGLLSDPSCRHVANPGSILVLSNELLSGLNELKRFAEGTNCAAKPETVPPVLAELLSRVNELITRGAALAQPSEAMKQSVASMAQGSCKTEPDERKGRKGRLVVQGEAASPAVPTQPDSDAANGKATNKNERGNARRQTRYKWLAEAMLLVKDHPEWSDAEIARRVGKDKSQLSRSREYQAAAALARQPKKTPPTGYKNSASGDFDAWQQD